jgi:hypothetical protein
VRVKTELFYHKNELFYFYNPAVKIDMTLLQWGVNIEAIYIPRMDTTGKRSLGFKSLQFYNRLFKKTDK